MSSSRINHLSSYHPDLEELDKKCRWMQPDLILSYKRAALEAADADTGNVIEDSDTMSAGISSRDVVSRARDLIFAKYPKVKNSRVNPPPAPKVWPRWDALSDVDNFSLYVDDAERVEVLPERQQLRRAPKPKINANLDNSQNAKMLKDVPSRSVSDSMTTTLPQGTKRKATADFTYLEDTPPPKPQADLPLRKRVHIESEKENESNPPKPSLPAQPSSWLASIPFHSHPAAAAMNVSKKRALRDIDALSTRSSKKARLNPQPSATAHSFRQPSNTVDAPENAPLTDDECDTQNLADNNTAPQAQQEPQRESPDDSFSDQTSLFEQVLSQQTQAKREHEDETGDVEDVLLDSGFNGTIKHASLTSATTASPVMDIKAAPPLVSTGSPPVPSPLSVSRENVEPSLRTRPSAMEYDSPIVPYIQSDGRAITCFRVAEALRIRTSAMTSAIPLAAASLPFPSIEIELFARINLTYRASTTQVFVFEDVWFPNRLPILRAVHESWRYCEQQEPALLRENHNQATSGGFLCRAIVRLDTHMPIGLDDTIQGEVVSVRAADWVDIKKTRSIVEPKYQNV